MSLLKRILKSWGKQSYVVLLPGNEASPEFEAFEAASPKEKKQLLEGLVGLHDAAENLLKELILDHTSQRRQCTGGEPSRKKRLTYDPTQFSLEEEGECHYHTLSISGPDVRPSDQHVFVSWDYSQEDYYRDDFPLREMCDPNWRLALKNAQKAWEKEQEQDAKADAAEKAEREKTLLLKLHLKYPGVLRNY